MFVGRKIGVLGTLGSFRPTTRDIDRRAQFVDGIQFSQTTARGVDHSRHSGPSKNGR